MKLRDNIKGVQHLGIPVVQMEETRKFYIENFGFKVIHEKEIFYPEKMKICFLQLGYRYDRLGGAAVDLYRSAQVHFLSV